MKNDLYLLHYGVKGMKWGVRKDRDRSALKARRERAREAMKSRKSRLRNYTGLRGSEARTRYRKQDIDKMSNAELQAAVNRMNLERQYRTLTKVDIKIGQKESKRIMKKVSAVSTVALSNDPFILVNKR